MIDALLLAQHQVLHAHHLHPESFKAAVDHLALLVQQGAQRVNTPARQEGGGHLPLRWQRFWSRGPGTRVRDAAKSALLT